MIVKCKLVELLQLSDTLTSAKDSIEPLKYLKTVNLDTIQQFYQPALELAFGNEEMQGNIDKETKKTMSKMRFKWLNSRVSALENAINGEEFKSSFVPQAFSVSESFQPQDRGLLTRVTNVEYQIKMCEHV